jgi:hypothetical protein
MVTFSILKFGEGQPLETVRIAWLPERWVKCKNDLWILQVPVSSLKPFKPKNEVLIILCIVPISSR